MVKKMIFMNGSMIRVGRNTGKSRLFFMDELIKVYKQVKIYDEATSQEIEQDDEKYLFYKY